MIMPKSVYIVKILIGKFRVTFFKHYIGSIFVYYSPLKNIQHSKPILDQLLCFIALAD